MVYWLILAALLVGLLAWRRRYLIPAVRYIALGRVDYFVQMSVNLHRKKGGVEHIVSDKQRLHGRALRDGIHIEHPSGDMYEISYEVYWG